MQSLAGPPFVSHVAHAIPRPCTIKVPRGMATKLDTNANMVVIYRGTHHINQKECEAMYFGTAMRKMLDVVYIMER